MEYYITQAKIVLPVLGINLLPASAVSPAGSAGIAPGIRLRRRQLSLSTWHTPADRTYTTEPAEY
jgi:hypothetical protein